MTRRLSIVLTTALLLTPSSLLAQRTAAADTRTQYPSGLANSYFTIGVGHLDYPFTTAQLEPGFTAAAVEIPHVTARVVLFGHAFGKYLAAQGAYMRPVKYVTYRSINGDGRGHQLLVHFGSVSLVPRLPLTSRLGLFGEIGLAVTARRPIGLGGRPAVRAANFPSPLLGGGLDLKLTERLDLSVGATYQGGSATDNHPRAIFTAAGLRYTMRKLPADKVAANRDAGFIFPKQLIQVEATGGVGYSVNRFLSHNVPVFWGGNVKVDRGVAVHYDRNVFHTRKIFSLDIGTSASRWRSRDNREQFVTLSFYPLLRFTLLRSAAADFYFQYSLAGPTYISRLVLDTQDTGKHFTFQDFMGIGTFLGRERRFSLGLKINHYSNGNIFVENAGVKVPLTVTVGYTF